MEELPQDQVEKQVHNDPVPAEPEYTLEEIMREFGGGSKREDEPAKPETMPESAETEIRRLHRRMTGKRLRRRA